jgi:hypothetical protein
MVMKPINYRYIAYLVSKTADYLEDVKEQFQPDDDEALADLVLNVDKAIKLLEAEALDRANRQESA